MAHLPSARYRSRGLGPFAVAAMVATAALAATTPSVLLNQSPSEPPGLYLRSGEGVAPGQIIAFKVPASAFPYADRNMAYLHHRTLLKAVAAGPGDLVCTQAGELVINGRVLAPIATHDRQGRALPRWIDCRRLAADELFVFSDRVPNSFDSRYYGPVRRADVVGSYRLVAAFDLERL